MASVNFNLQGDARKELANEIGAIMGVAPVYAGPGGKHRYSFVIMNVIVTKEGEVIWDERTSAETMNNVFDGLEARGYTFDRPMLETAEPTEVEAVREQPLAKRRGILDVLEEEINATLPEGERTYRLHSEPTIIDGHGRQHSLDGRFAVAPAYGEISEPTDGEIGKGDVPTTISIEFPDTNVKPDILAALLNSKSSLIETALGDDCAWEREYGTDGLPLCDLPIEFVDGKVAFEWLKFGADSEAVQAWSAFLAAAVKFSKTAKRVTAKDEGVPENAKFAFRTFLVKLKMNDADNKAHRKYLLRNLNGDSAFATPESKAKWQSKHLKNGGAGAEVVGDE